MPRRSKKSREAKACQLKLIAEGRKFVKKSKKVPNVVQGFCHQGDTNQFSKSSAGMQCSCNALIAIVFLNMHNGITWRHINKILFEGDKLYRIVRERLLQLGKLEVLEHLTIKDLPSEVLMDQVLHKFKHFDSLYARLRLDTRLFIDPSDCGSLDQEPLRLILQHAFRLSNTSILVMGNNMVTLFSYEKGWYGIFDPHSRNDKGMPTEDGYAVLLNFLTLSKLVDHLYKLADSLSLDNSTVLEIKPITISSTMPTKPSESKSLTFKSFFNDPVSQKKVCCTFLCSPSPSVTDGSKDAVNGMESTTVHEVNKGHELGKGPQPGKSKPLASKIWKCPPKLKERCVHVTKGRVCGKCKVRRSRTSQLRRKRMMFAYTYKHTFARPKKTLNHCKTKEESEALLLTRDVQKLAKYLSFTLPKTRDWLMKDPNCSKYDELSILTAAELILFNKPRADAVMKLTVQSYNEQVTKLNPDDEILQSLSDVEKKLCERLDVMKVPDSEGNLVPILLTPSSKAAMATLVEMKSLVNIDSSNPYLFAKCESNQDSMKSSIDVLNTVSEKAGLLRNTRVPQHAVHTAARNTGLLNDVQLQHQVATISQLMSIQDNEVDWLKSFIADIVVIDSNQLSNLQTSTLEMATVVQMLLSIESGKAHQHTGKTWSQLKLSDITGTADDKVLGQHVIVKVDLDAGSIVTEDTLGYPGADGSDVPHNAWNSRTLKERKGAEFWSILGVPGDDSNTKRSEGESSHWQRYSTGTETGVSRWTAPEEGRGPHGQTQGNSRRMYAIVRKEAGSNEQNFIEVLSGMHACIFCETLLWDMMSHLLQSHKCEEEVTEALLKPRGIDALIQRGDHLHNVKVLQRRHGTFLVSQLSGKTKSPEDYMPCPDCLAYIFYAEYLSHRRDCKVLKEKGGDCKQRRADPDQTPEDNIVNSPHFAAAVSKIINAKALRNLVILMLSDLVLLLPQNNCEISLYETQMISTNERNDRPTQACNDEIAEIVGSLKEIYSTCLEKLLDPSNFLIIFKLVNWLCEHSRQGNFLIPGSHFKQRLISELGHYLKACATHLKVKDEGCENKTGLLCRIEKYLSVFDSMAASSLNASYTSEQTSTQQIGFGIPLVETSTQQNGFGIPPVQTSTQQTGFGITPEQTSTQQTGFGIPPVQTSIQPIGFGIPRVQTSTQQIGFGIPAVQTSTQQTDLGIPVWASSQQIASGSHMKGSVPQTAHQRTISPQHSVHGSPFLATIQQNAIIAQLDANSQKIAKFPEILSIVEDVLELEKYLNSTIVQEVLKPVSQQNIEQYLTLLEATVAKLILFNKPRANEVVTMTVATYKDNQGKLEPCHEMFRCLSSTERKLCERFAVTVVQTPNKDGVVVPILMTPMVKIALDFLLNFRSVLCLHSVNEYMFAKNRKDCVNVCGVLNTLTAHVELQAPHFLFSVNMDRYVAASCHVLALNDCDLDWLKSHVHDTISFGEEVCNITSSSSTMAKIVERLCQKDSSATPGTDKAGTSSIGEDYQVPQTMDTSASSNMDTLDTFNMTESIDEPEEEKYADVLKRMNELEEQERDESVIRISVDEVEEKDDKSVVKMRVDIPIKVEPSEELLAERYSEFVRIDNTSNTVKDEEELPEEKYSDVLRRECVDKERS